MSRIRVAIEKRAALSPDTLTGMEASLRFAGPETMETKIFGRLTAWQNWIFHRPNAAGEHGALISRDESERRASEWLPAAQDREYVRSLMSPVTERGKIADWIAPSATGTNHRPFGFEYVRL